MVSFNAAASVLVLLASTANASFELIANYEPQSQVTDHVSYIIIMYYLLPFVVVIFIVRYRTVY